MDIIKKICAVMIVCAMIPSLIYAYDVPVDVRGTAFETEVSVLEQLGILDKSEDNEFFPESAVTRAEFASAVARLMDVQIEVEDIGMSPYSDIAPAYWAYSDIVTISSLGVLQGVGGGRFAPEEPVTYEQVAKALVMVAGYDFLARQKGGYPIGYLSAAMEKNLIRRVTVKEGKAVLRSEFALMLYDTLNAYGMSRTNYGENSEYKTDKEPIMTRNLGIYKHRGVITANHDTRLNGRSNLQKGEVEIDGYVFKAGETDAADFLGYQVVYYIQENHNGDYVILCVIPHAAGYGELLIEADKLCPDSGRFSYTNIAYLNENGREVYAPVSGSADVIYNKKANLNATVQTLKIRAGNLHLIDNNADGLYDVIFVNEFENYLVDGIDAGTFTVYDRYGKNIVLDEGDKGKTITFYKDGNVVPFKTISKNDVLCVYVSADESMIDVTIVRNSVKGVISEINSTENTFLIDGNIYKEAYGYSRVVHPERRILSVGDAVVVYLDAYGMIAGANYQSAGAKKYVYLASAYAEKGISNKAVFKVFTAEKAVKEMKSADKMIFNGSAKDSSHVSYNGAMVVEALNARGRLSQLIMIELNGSDEIYKLWTAGPTGSLGYDDENFSLDAELTEVRYRLNNNSLGGNLILFGSDTVVFVEPSADASGMVDTDDLAIMPVSSFIDDRFYTVKAYDMDAARIPKALTVSPQDIDTAMRPLSLVVTKVISVLNASGSETMKVYGWYERQEVSYTAADDIAVQNRIKNLKEGDCVQVSLNFHSQIIGLNDLWIGDEHPGVGYGPYARAKSGSSVIGEQYNIYGMIYYRNNDVFSVTTDGGASISGYRAVANTSIYVFDRLAPAGQRIRLGTINDVIAAGKGESDGSWAFMHLRWNQVRDLVIIK